MNALTKFRSRRPGVPAIAKLAGAMLAVLAGIGGSLAFAASTASAATLTPIFDLTGNTNAISLDAPFVYAMQDNAHAAPAAPWTMFVNDNPTGVNPLGSASSIWAPGDVLNIVVAGPGEAINHFETGNWVTFASLPFVGIVGENPTTSGITPPTVTAVLTTYSGDSADSNDAGITDDLQITFSGTVDPANTSFILEIGLPTVPVTYNTGATDPVGPITTLNSSYTSASVVTPILVPPNAEIVGATVSANNPPVSVLPSAVGAPISPISITETASDTIGSDPIVGDTSPLSEGYICVTPSIGSFATPGSLSASPGTAGVELPPGGPVSIIPNTQLFIPGGSNQLVAQVAGGSSEGPATFTFTGMTVDAPDDFSGPVTATVTIDQNSDCDNPLAVTLLVPGSAVFNNVTIYTVGLNSTGTGAVGRIAGVTSEGTAVAALQTQYPDNPPFGFCLPNGTHLRPSRYSSGGTIILTTDANDGFDALAASYLAGHYDTGVLVTEQTNSVDPLTLTGIEDEGANNIIIVGGTSAVSADDQTELENTPAYFCGGSSVQTNALGAPLMLNVIRVAGPDVDGTAAAVADFVDSGAVGNANISGAFGGQYNDTLGTDSGSAPNDLQRTVILSTNLDSQDAETASSMSYFQSFPILYTGKETLDPETAAAILNLDPGNIIEFGGQLALDAPVNAAIEALGLPISILRIAGADASETSVQAAKFELNTDHTGAGQPKGLAWGELQPEAFPPADNCLAPDPTSDLTGNSGDFTPGTDAYDCETVVALVRGDYFVDGVTSSVVTGNGPYPVLLTENPTTLGTYLTAFFNAAGSPFGIDPVTNNSAPFVPFTGEEIDTIIPFGGPLALAQSTVQAALNAIAAGANP
jgi:putative cell wall-binding protein